MHESRLVAQLIARVESEVDPAETRVTRLALRIGVMSSVAPVALRQGIEEHATAAWGYSPEVEVEPSDDVGDSAGFGVTLVSIQVED